MSIRKVTICLAVILFISATVLAFTSNKRAEKKAEKEYTPTVQTVTMTAVGDCTLATDINADPNGSFKSVAESLNGDYSYFFKNVSPIFSEDDLTIVNFEGTLSNQGTRQDKQFAFRGKPEYVQIKSVFDQMDVLRASGSMPVVSKPVKLGNEWYLDGAVTDSIPYEHMLDMGYDRVVVVLTKPADYIKKPMPRFLTSVYKKRFPRFYEAFSNRHIMYNYQLEHLKELEKQGIAEVLRPSEHIKISKIEKDPNKLESLYQLGLRDAKRLLADKQGMEKQ